MLDLATLDRKWTPAREERERNNNFKFLASASVVMGSC